MITACIRHWQVLKTVDHDRRARLGGVRGGVGCQRPLRFPHDGHTGSHTPLHCQCAVVVETGQDDWSPGQRAEEKAETSGEYCKGQEGQERLSLWEGHGGISNRRELNGLAHGCISLPSLSAPQDSAPLPLQAHKAAFVGEEEEKCPQGPRADRQYCRDVAPPPLYGTLGSKSTVVICIICFCAEIHFTLQLLHHLAFPFYHWFCWFDCIETRLEMSFSSKLKVLLPSDFNKVLVGYSYLWAFKYRSGLQ